MAGFSVDLEALLAAVDQMSQFDSRLEQSLARAKSSVESLDCHGMETEPAPNRRHKPSGTAAPKNCARRSVSCATSQSRRTETIPTPRQ